MLDNFSDRLTDVMAKLEDSDQYQELAGWSICALYCSTTKVTRVSSYRVSRVVAHETQERWTVRIFEMVAEASR